VTAVMVNMYNNERADEIILSLFPTFLCYCELLWQHFPPVFLKLQLCQLGSNIPGDQEGLFKLAIQLRKCFYSAVYNTATGYVLWVYLTDI
jgi:hypothetical protein